MRLGILVASLIGLSTAAPGSRLFHHSTQTHQMTVILLAQSDAPPASIEPDICPDGTRSNDVYIISNRRGACGTNNIRSCTTRADKVERLCGDTCVRTVNATTGKAAEIYGLSHPRPDGGFFILYNGTNCEKDKVYLRYSAQRIGTGPVRYVQTTHIKPMEVSPFWSFRYSPTRN